MLVRLSKRGFKICDDEYKKSLEYYCCSAVVLVNGQERKEVRRRGQSPQSACLTNDKKSSCKVFVAYQVQYRHLFAFHDRKFLLGLVDSKFHLQALSTSSPNPDYRAILSAYCATREHYAGSLGDKLLIANPSSPSTWDNGSDNSDDGDDDPPASLDNNDENWVASSREMMCVTTHQELAADNNGESLFLQDREVVRTIRKKLTFRDFAEISNQVTSLALTLPNEDAKYECLGFLVEMRDALSMSAAGCHHGSLPSLSEFRASADNFLHAFGQNTDLRREKVFLPSHHGNSSFEMQHHNIGKVRQKRLTSQNERNSHGVKRRRPAGPAPAILTEMSQNPHLLDARNRPAQCSYCSSCEHTIRSCPVMDKVASVGKKNSSG